MSQYHSAPATGRSATIVGYHRRWIDRFARRAGPDSSGRIVVEARQIYILPTRFGILFAIMLIAMLIGANNYGSNPGFLFTFLLAGLGMAALFQTWKNLLGLELSAAGGDPVFLGTAASFGLMLSNSGSAPKAGIGLRLHRTMTVAADRLDIGPGESRTGHIALQPQHRGWTHLPCVVIESIFPLGLFRAWVYVDIEHRCLVYPKPAASGSGFDQSTTTPNTAVSDTQDGDDFAGHRPYQHGDNMHHVDWKVVARGKGWHTKQFAAERGEQIWLRLAAADGQNVEQRLASVTRAVLDFEELSAQYGLDLGNQQIEPDRGMGHRDICLKALALFGSSDTGEFDGH